MPVNSFPGGDDDHVKAARKGQEDRWAAKAGPVEVSYREPQAPRYTLIARKNSTCGNCREIIRVGDPIRGTRGRWSHVHCPSLRTRARDLPKISAPAEQEIDRVMELIFAEK